MALQYPALAWSRTVFNDQGLPLPLARFSSVSGLLFSITQGSTIISSLRKHLSSPGLCGCQAGLLSRLPPPLPPAQACSALRLSKHPCEQPGAGDLGEGSRDGSAQRPLEGESCSGPVVAAYSCCGFAGYHQPPRGTKAGRWWRRGER